MKRAGRLVFLLTFALLQCVSPLAHAHWGSDASGGRFHGFHFQDASPQQQHDQGMRMSGGNHSPNASHLPVVKVPDGKQRTHTTAVLPPAVDRVGAQLEIPAAPSEAVSLDDSRIDLPSPFFKQYSQAPPQRA